jgi:hypothetical protein
MNNHYEVREKPEVIGTVSDTGNEAHYLYVGSNQVEPSVFIKAIQDQAYARFAEEVKKLHKLVSNPDSHHPPRCLTEQDIDRILNRLTGGGENE